MSALFFLAILCIFWFIRTLRITLFWIYLWQMKEYHIGRFLDHFSTAKGKNLIFNRLLFAKLFLVFFLAAGIFTFSKGIVYVSLFDFSITLILILYATEAFYSLWMFFGKKFKKPVLTQKTVFLVAVLVFLETVFIIFVSSRFNYIVAVFYLLYFDILTPLVISAVVLLLQPWAVFLRNRVIKAARKKREKLKDLTAIGITGSYGKTSTKEFLVAILKEKFNVLATEKHQNSEIGISRCILSLLKPETQIFIAEMGAYNKGGIKLLSSIVEPKIGIITGINEQHLSTFGSVENIIAAKFELIGSLPEDGTAILNGDNEYIKSNIKSQIAPSGEPKPAAKIKTKNIKYYSTREKADVWAENINVKQESLSFEVFSKDGDNAAFNLPLLGSHNVENVLAAACCAKELGMNLKDISLYASKNIRQEQGGAVIWKSKKGTHLINSTYSANPSGVIAHLEYLKLWPAKKIMIMPSLIELGSSAGQIHRRIGEKIAEVCDLAIVVSKDRFSDLKAGALGKGMKENAILFIEDPKNIFEKLKNFLVSDDVILLEGRLPAELIKEIKDSL